MSEPPAVAGGYQRFSNAEVIDMARSLPLPVLTRDRLTL